MKPTYLIGLGVMFVSLAGGGIYGYVNQNGDPASGNMPKPEGPFTAEVVAEHASADDCWMIIEGSVYDVTSYVSKHPGGKEIERGCGIDATELFNTRPDTVKDGTPHSSFARDVLADFKIGELESGSSGADASDSETKPDNSGKGNAEDQRGVGETEDGVPTFEQ